MNRVNRRDAIKTASAAALSTVFPAKALSSLANQDSPIRLGVIADLHGGLAVDAEARLDAFLTAIIPQECDALIQLGDFAYPNPKYQAFPEKLNMAHDDVIHVIGNHEFDFGLKRADCYQAWGIENSYYRRDIGGLRVLVLDGNDQGSPDHGGGYPSYIGQPQQRWLSSELERSERPVLILSHQPLAGTAAIDNASELQELLSKHQNKIVACFNGHSHVDSFTQVGGVPYLHVNSASYYWVGGRTRMAYYTRPLFTTVIIDPASATVSVESSDGDWKGKSPKEIGYFDDAGRPPESIVTPRIRAREFSPTKLSVMTWNIWGRLNQDDRYTAHGKTSRDRTIEIIRDSGVDLVAMIETYGSASEIAAELDYRYHTVSNDANLCIFSRYPLSDIQLLEGLNPFSFIAATVTLPRGEKVRVYDIWLTSGGRHIVDIKDDSVPDQTFADGDDLRFDHLQQLLNHPQFKQDVEAASETPMIVAGDFNCVSHLDYTPATRDRGLNYDRILPIKTSKAMESAGFIDTYRAANPNITSKTLGYTWTTVGNDYVYESNKGFVKVQPGETHPRPQYRDLYTRIDYIYCQGDRLSVQESHVIDRHPKYPDQKFPTFPSDHAAVVTTFEVAGSKQQR